MMLKTKMLSIDFVSWDWKVEKKLLFREGIFFSRCELGKQCCFLESKQTRNKREFFYLFRLANVNLIEEWCQDNRRWCQRIREWCQNIITHFFFVIQKRSFKWTNKVFVEYDEISFVKFNEISFVKFNEILFIKFDEMRFIKSDEMSFISNLMNRFRQVWWVVFVKHSSSRKISS
jgi:hypothetical protein